VFQVAFAAINSGLVNSLIGIGRGRRVGVCDGDPAERLPTELAGGLALGEIGSQSGLYSYAWPCGQRLTVMASMSRAGSNPLTLRMQLIADLQLEGSKGSRKEFGMAGAMLIA